MKRLLLIMAACAACFGYSLRAQQFERIKADPETVWAEGTGADPTEADRAALGTLVRKIAYFADFQVPESRKVAVAHTYLTEIRRRAKSYYEEGKMLRYLSSRDIEELFQARLNRAEELRKAADALPNRLEAARMYRWAWTYMASLPGDRRKALAELEATIRSCEAGAGTSALPPVIPSQRHIAREAEQIAQALGVRPHSFPREVPQKVQPVPTPEIAREQVPQRPAFPTLPALPVIPSFCPAPGGPSAGLPVTPPARRPAPLPPRIRPFTVMGTLGLSPDPTVGFMLQYCRQWGVCVAASTSWGPRVKGAFSARSDGTAGDRFLWPDGTVSTGGFSLTCGPAWRIAPGFSSFLTLGYGSRDIFWRDRDGQWARIVDRSPRGFTAEAGVIATWGPAAISASVRSVCFRTLAVSIGAGISF